MNSRKLDGAALGVLKKNKFLILMQLFHDNDIYGAMSVFDDFMLVCMALRGR